MTEFISNASPGLYFLSLVLVVLLLIFWLIYRRRVHAHSFKGVTNRIAFEIVNNLIIPGADEGEIQIDHLLLTSEGILILDVKDVVGTVFGSDKMQDWTVIGERHRFTFANPQPALYDRIAAVRQIARQIPVTGRILFLDGAKFTKGIPGLVYNLDDLLADFDDTNDAATKVKLDAFRSQWALIKASGKMTAPRSERRKAPTI